MRGFFGEIWYRLGGYFLGKKKGGPGGFGKKWCQLHDARWSTVGRVDPN